MDNRSKELFMLLSFPYMHPELFHAKSIPGIMFFDPGLQAETSENSFRPEELPMDSKTAKSLIQDSISFGEQFKDPGEMSYFGAMTTDEFYEGSSMSIQAQLTQRFNDGQGGKVEREKKEAISKAQFILLLGWFFEEHLIELQGVEKGVKKSWESIDTTLGVAEEDRIEERVLDLGNIESHTGGTSDGQSIPFPWQRIAEALPAFLPSDTVLVCTDTEIIAQWDEFGIPFISADKKLGLPDGAEVAVQPAWKFGCRHNAPAELPFALSELTVAIIR
jgi:hypothetical protein